VRDFSVVIEQAVGYLQSIFYNRFLIMSLINLFHLIKRLYIVQLSKDFKKYFECSDRLFDLLSHHEIIVVHKPLP